jgi:ubiquinol-cytochrome c reductase cytochrome c1 subunit
MIRISTIAAAIAVSLSLAVPAIAQEQGEAAADSTAHATPYIEKQPWSFAGIFGTFDVNQLQRGFQVFQSVCANCHGAHLMSFRNLHEPGGPEYSEEQVKALAASFEIADPTVEGGTRPGIPADRWPSLLSDADGLASFGVVPPDLSVMAKARGTTQPFPWWIANYFTAYAEGGPDYIYALMMGYRDPPPEGAEVPDGKYYNEYFPGHAIGMPPQLFDGSVDYEGDTFPETADQYARDVSAFLMWLAEPHLVARKESGLRVIIFLILFAGLMWFVKQRLWGPIHRHNPSPAEVAVSGTPTAPAADPPRGNH